MSIYARDGVARAVESEAIRRVEREAETQEFAQKERMGRKPGRKRQRDEPAPGAEAVDLSELYRSSRPEAADAPDDAAQDAGAEPSAAAIERRVDIEA